jgi:hypothetical protein
MKNLLRLGVVVLFMLSSCGTSQYGKKLDSPFSGSKYESSRRYFRAVGKGQSSSERVASKKSSMAAKTDIASQVSVTMKSVADDYIHENANANANEVYSKLESLSREVMSTELADMRKIGTKTYYDKESNSYTSFVAYEINKKSMLKFMKKRAEALGKDSDEIVKRLEKLEKDLESE